MGVDSRGKERGECQECDCSDYEVPDKGNRCSYCDCAPTKHQLNSASKSSTKAGTKGGTPAKTAASKDNSRNSSKSNSKAVLDSSQSDNAEQAAPKNKSWTARLKAGSPARAKVNAIARLSRPNTKGTQYSSQDEIPEKQAAPAKKSNWPSRGNVSPLARMARPVSKDNAASSDDKPEPKQQPKKSAKDIRADFEVTALDQTPLDAEPEPVKQTPARNNSRPPPTRRGEQQRNQSPKDGGSGPMPPAGAKPRKKKSVAVKCHNLDQVMSSHLSDPSTRKRIDEMFTTFDDDASNELDREECKDLTGYILQQCGLQPDIIPAFVYDEAFDKYDDDGGGTITLDEFREFLNAFLESK